MMKDTMIVILAGGQEAEMRSNLAKALHPLCGIPMLNFPLEIARLLSTGKTLVIVDHQGKKIEGEFRSKDLVFIQEESGGDLATSIMKTLQGFHGTVLVLRGDIPLLREETARKLILLHEELKSSVTTLLYIICRDYRAK